MKALQINVTGNWIAAATLSLVGHVAVAAVITSFEGTSLRDEPIPIIVELVVLDDTKPKRIAPYGNISPNNNRIATSVIALETLSAPPITTLASNKIERRNRTAIRKIDPPSATGFDAAPQDIQRPNTSNEHAYVSKPWVPPAAEMLLESVEQPRPKPSSFLHAAALPAVVPDIEKPTPAAKYFPLKALPVKPMKPELAVKLLQREPEASQIMFAGALGFARPKADAHPPLNESASTDLTGEVAQVPLASAVSVHVAGTVQPFLRPPGVTRGVQVGAGNRPPKYPLSARRRGLEGRVLLRVEVDTTGSAQRVAITKSSGHKVLDEAARRATRKWQFLPALVASEAASGAIDIPIVFYLD